MKNPLDNPSSNSGIQYLLRIQYQTPRHGNTESQIVLELHLPSLNKPFLIEQGAGYKCVLSQLN